ncbi:lipoprotein [Mycoplasma mycoides]|uniref:lipoprotein n=1 Tax=Mycoplasma mycoides TaxID=2102 RepID=UPI00223FC9C0|nr:lipoprotein [Mycoplasma mycoides]
MKKLLTLLGSVAVIGSTAAVAIACEGKPLSVVVNKEAGKESKAQTLESTEKTKSEGENEVGQPNNGETAKLKKQIGEAEKAVEDAKKDYAEAKENQRKANQNYQNALEKGKPYKEKEKAGQVPKEIWDEIQKTENELSSVAKKYTEAELKLKAAKEKLQKLRDSRPANAGDPAGATIEA